MGKIKVFLDEKKQEIHKKKVEKELAKFEQEITEERERQAVIKAAQEEIEVEKQRLYNLNEKELFAEAILAIRGFYLKFERLAEQMDDVNERIKELEKDIIDLESEINSLSYSNND